MMELLTSPTIDWGSGRNQCIMTYQALTALVRRNAEMGVFMRNHFDIVIEDEAHRGLGNKTKTATEELTATEEDEEREIQEAEEIVQ
jgi:type I site-specific restriction endonuclease